MPGSTIRDGVRSTDRSSSGMIARHGLFPALTFVLVLSALAA